MARAAKNATVTQKHQKVVAKTATKRKPKEKMYYVLAHNKLFSTKLVGLYETVEKANEDLHRLDSTDNSLFSLYTVREVKLIK